MKVGRLQVPRVENLDPQVLVEHLTADGDAAQVGRVQQVNVVVVMIVAVVAVAVGSAEARLLQRSLWGGCHQLINLQSCAPVTLFWNRVPFLVEMKSS